MFLSSIRREEKCFSSPLSEKRNFSLLHPARRVQKRESAFTHDSVISEILTQPFFAEETSCNPDNYYLGIMEGIHHM